MIFTTPKEELMDKQKKDDKKKKQYVFGGIKEFDLEKIESEVLNESMYLEVFAGSDIRFKKNIKPIDGALNRLFQLNGVTFDWKTEEFIDKGFTDDKQIGFLAQDVKAQFPQLVKNDHDGYLTVNYSKMVPALVEGMREMTDLIQSQKNTIKLLQERVTKLESKK